MVAMAPYVDDVIADLSEALSTAEVTESDLVGGVRVVVPEEDIGSAFGKLRRSDYEFESKRGPSGNLIVNVDADTGIGPLFE